MPFIPYPNPTGTAVLPPGECASGIASPDWRAGRRLLLPGLTGAPSVPVRFNVLAAWLSTPDTQTGQSFRVGIGGGGEPTTHRDVTRPLGGAEIGISIPPVIRNVPVDGSDPIFSTIENVDMPEVTYRTSAGVASIDGCAHSADGFSSSLYFESPPKASEDQSLYREERVSPSSHRFFMPEPIDWGTSSASTPQRSYQLYLVRVDAPGSRVVGMNSSRWHLAEGLVSGAVYDVYWAYRDTNLRPQLYPDAIGSYGGFSKRITVDPKPGVPVVSSVNSTATGLGALISWSAGDTGQREITSAQAYISQDGVIVTAIAPIDFNPDPAGVQPLGEIPLPRRGETFQVRVRYLSETGVWSDYSAPQNVTTTSPSFDPGTYWDGSTEADRDNVYSWSGAVGNSASVRSVYPVENIQRAAGDSSTKLFSLTDPSSPIDTQNERVLALLRSFLDPRAASLRVYRAAVDENVLVRFSYWVKFNPNDFYEPINDRPLQMDALVFGTGIEDAPPPIPIELAPGEWTRIVFEPFELTAGPSTYVHLSLVQPQFEGRTLSPSESLSFDGFMLSTSGARFDYFDGATPTGDGFRYEWTGEANASSSVRDPATLADPRKPFIDPNCPPVPAAPRPPVVPSSCGEVDADTWRRYWIEIPQSETFTSRALLPTLRITSGFFAENLVRIRFWKNPENLPAVEFDEAGGYDGELIINFIPANAEMVLDGVSRLLTGSVNGSETQILNNLLSGTDGTPPTWPVMDCSDGWLISVDVLPESPEGNLDVSVDLTARMG